MTQSTDAEFDRHMMGIALTMARRALGTTCPNPSVGAVIADPDTKELISRAHTHAGGRPHAEPIAIERAGSRARGKTMYVTLEPCSHTGKTPPCCDPIIESGLDRVVVAQRDPDPRVSGRGIERLKDTGLTVDELLLYQEAHDVTLGHILRVSERRPFIQLKMALGADGEIPRGDGTKPVWVTGPLARAHAHMLRAKTDAILIGAGTLRDDDPELTCRLPGLADRSPVRVVLANPNLVKPGSKLLQTTHETPVWLAYGSASGQAGTPQPSDMPKPGADVATIPLPSVLGHAWLPALAEALVAKGITRLLVEGGPTIWRMFAKAGLVDEVVAFIANETTGAAKSSQQPDPAHSQIIAERSITNLLPSLKLVPRAQRRLGPDTMFVFKAL